MTRRPILVAVVCGLVVITTDACSRGIDLGAQPEPTARPSPTGTTPSTPQSPDGEPEPPPTTSAPTTDEVASADPADLLSSLSPGGQQLASGIDWAQRPRYGLRARLDPDRGRVEGAMRALLPVGADATEVRLRWFPAVAAEDVQLVDVHVDGAAVEPIVDDSLVTIAVEPGHSEAVEVTARFAYNAPLINPAAAAPLNGDALQPTDIGLLARSEGALTLGHWFPIWIPPGFSTDATLDGFGDIANFPAATIVAELDVPDGFTVVTGGTRLASSVDGRDGLVDPGGSTTITEGGLGLRDLAVVVMRSPAQVATTAAASRVVVTAPEATAENDVVLGHAAASLDTLSAAFGSYPWAELDVVAAPLGSGVGGMEWPGMVWIEPTIFAGGLPGMGDLGELAEIFGGDSELSEIFGSDGELSELFGSDSELSEIFGSTFGDIGLLAETVREWTVAHEIGHMWWHATVGNDSLVTPVLDEALAQHSACLVERDLRPDQAEEVCAAHTSGQYTQLRSMMGVADAPADRPSEEFGSSTQYGAVVYGKAPGLYRELENSYGVDATTAALAGVVEQHAFDQITSDDLRSALGTALGDPSGVDALWQRWMEEAHGDDDLTD